ncbi:conserved hypothetical protein [Pseudarthrobacter chlorophenolicus A6]|uniref:Uncharacterized protein n=1 Tax=Pseudarthrobacter chlorophenolicus (strain ATCC 700700 / DSM 12829 / CIP 107037 / JCM 12360 / KCTC 9906 / NCIMB 13794 / A6) TaxID=452863 RepID=B8H9N7_PSECP|nr:hypothetical protein [Pseudarthrobacter chlorophenolicus]ACL40106.1 conserved hypothetical protein [Pseudarthrobacter chlorophenolicus A6]SDQ87705.1 hypothetical protein SAMN04489738_3359 [Pseudarthrobacter chlorophenolicus]
MSQEQPPIRSRRELRKARDAAQQAAVPAGKDQPSPATKPSSAATAGTTGKPQKPVAAAAPAPAKPAPAKPAAAKLPAAPDRDQQPVDQPAAVPAHTQRSSQIRARDRAALRTIKDLEEKEGQLAAGGPPTRRQLRLQQLKEQALTSANPIVPPAATPAVVPSKAPVRPEPAGDSTAAPSAGGESKAPAAPGAPSGTPAPKTAGAPSGPAGMTVEQALAARSLIAEQAKNQIAKMEHIASMDPEAVDPEILAEQIALAERAAVLNRRAMARQKLAEQAGGAGAPADGQAADAGSAPAQPKAAPFGNPPPKAASPTASQPKANPPKSNPPQDRPGPSTTSNLAMVTPLEFVQVPGVDRPVMKPPATSHVPVTTRPGTKVPAAGGSKKKPAARAARAAEPVSGRSQVIARAEAAAKAATRPKPVVFPDSQATFEDVPRVPASSAYGLEPLDAATAGLGRARRNRILQFCILAFGVVALVSGVVLIISGMNP